MGSIWLEPIGHVRTAVPRESVKESFERLESQIEVLEPYRDALTGVDGFSHLIVLFFMHELPEERRATLVVKPRGLLRYGLSPEDLPTIGVFACDSPARPNPIGVSVVELLGRDGRILRVRGLDAHDGTPVLDVKPYTPDRVIPTPKVPAWQEELLRRSGARRV